MFDVNSPAAWEARNYVAYRLTGKPIKEEPITAYVKKVIYNPPVTIVYWTDNSKTVVKCQPGDEYSPLVGFLMAALKKSCGNTGNYNELLKMYVPGYSKEEENG